MFLLYSDIGYHQFEKKNNWTPNIDKLAKKGIVLEKYYTASLCTPSRASLLTGLYHPFTGLSSVLTPASPAGIYSQNIYRISSLKGRRGI